MKKIIATCLAAAVLTTLCGCAGMITSTSGDAAETALEEMEAKASAAASAEPTAEPTEAVPTSSLAGKIICVDAGHGINSYNKQEPIAPNTSETKIAFADGASGANQTEEELNLAVSLKLQKALETLGAEVHMTRTEHHSDMTNVDRAVFANELGADISVKIHADGYSDSSAHGVSVLIPGSKYISDSELLAQSKTAASCILEEYVKATGAKNRGLSVRNDLTGFNWSTVPIVLVEMGFMTNPQEDRLMETEEYQNKIVQGIVSGLEQYFQ